MIDIEKETLIPVAEVGDYIRSIGGRLIHKSTVSRWMTRGVDCGRRKLEAVKIGQYTYTSKEAIARFSVPFEGKPE